VLTIWGNTSHACDVFTANAEALWSVIDWEQGAVFAATAVAGIGCGLLGGPALGALCAGAVGGGLGAAVAGGDVSAVLWGTLFGSVSSLAFVGVGQLGGQIAFLMTTNTYASALSAMAVTTGASLGMQSVMGGEIDWTMVAIQGVISAIMAFHTAAQMDAAMEQAKHDAAVGKGAGEAYSEASNGGTARPGHASAGQAAHAALAQEVPASVATNREHGGLIYRKGGRYFATPAVVGSEGVVEVWDAKSSVPAGATIVGDYHTHPATVIGEPWWTNGETFSGYGGLSYVPEELAKFVSDGILDKTDIYGAVIDIRTRQGLDAGAFTSFISTPSGRFGVHNVASGGLFYFSPDPRLMSPGVSWSSLARP
jgi:hypothetical protein